MTGSVVSRGGVRVEFLPGAPKPWRARMRDRTGLGESLEEAADNLVDGIRRELTVAQAFRAGLRKEAKR